MMFYLPMVIPGVISVLAALVCLGSPRLLARWAIVGGESGPVNSIITQPFVAQHQVVIPISIDITGG